MTQGINDPVISFTTEITPKVSENDVAFTIRQRDYKDAQSVAIKK